MKFDANYTPKKASLGQYFYENPRQSIKLWLNKEGQDELAWENLVKKIVKVEFQAEI